MAPVSPLLRMARETPTDWWNDSCDVYELARAIDDGATGATSNPSIVLEVMRKDSAYWLPRVQELIAGNPSWTEVELSWAVVDEMATRGAAVLLPVFEAHGGRKGCQTVQTNPANYRDADAMVAQAVHLAGLAPNIAVKFPATAAGITAIEEATARGVNINATVSFTVAQAVAAAEAVERGLRRREARSLDVSSMMPIVTLMVGRLDDWLKAVIERDGLAVSPAAPSWAGIAVFKRAYEVFRERRYRSRLLSAAYRHPLHWTELIGGNLAMTLTAQWQARFNASGIEPSPRMDHPVDRNVVDELTNRVADFRRAYELDGLEPSAFDSFGAAVRTLRSFIGSYHDLMGAIRDVMLPNPDSRPGPSSRPSAGKS